MDEVPEVVLFRKAKRRLREANHLLLLVAIAIIVGGCVVIVWVVPWVEEAKTVQGYLVRYLAVLAGVGVLDFGAGIATAALQKPDKRGTRSVRQAILTSTPIVRHVVKFRDRRRSKRDAVPTGLR